MALPYKIYTGGSGIDVGAYQNTPDGFKEANLSDVINSLLAASNNSLITGKGEYLPYLNTLRQYNGGTITPELADAATKVYQGIYAQSGFNPRFSEVLTNAYGSTPSSVDSNYVIGPNGNLMTKENAANYQPSPQELSRGIRPTGIYAGGDYITLPNGSVVPKGTRTNTEFITPDTSNVLPPSVNLQPGSTDTESVKQLQDYLVSKGFMTREQVNTGYGIYGPQTTAAVAALQKSLGVDNSTGVGYFGPRTMAAINSQGTDTGAGADAGTGTGGTTPVSVHPDLMGILDNPNLTADQKASIQAIYNAVSTNDSSAADKIKAAMKAASEYSDPYFKAQIRLATDALSRGLNAKEGDLAFNEGQLKSALEELTKSTAASKDYLSFQHAQELKQLQQKYETDLSTTQDNLTAAGFTSSSKRARAEQILNENNTGLVESSNKQFGYQTGNLDATLAAKSTDTAAQIENLRRLAAEDKLNLLRTAESSVGTDALASLGYTGLLGGVGGEIPRNQVKDQLSFASNFVF